ncbi:MAG: hypothetical protein AAFX54_01770 [Pseudomonadota bacterium]
MRGDAPRNAPYKEALNDKEGFSMEPGWIGVLTIVGFLAVFGLLNIFEKGSLD